MALEKYFRCFDQGLVKAGSFITSQILARCFEAAPYLYEAIGDFKAPPAGGPAQSVAGHDHVRIGGLGGAYLSRGGVCFSSGGQYSLFSFTIDSSTNTEYKPFDQESLDANKPSFGFDTTAFPVVPGLGSLRCGYASPGITTREAINQADDPVMLDLRIRYYWPPSAEESLQFKVYCPDAASASGPIWLPKEADKRWTFTESAEVSADPNGRQSEVRLRLPVRGDWWNRIHLYFKVTKTPKESHVLNIMDIAIAETYRMSQPVSEGHSRYT